MNRLKGLQEFSQRALAASNQNQELYANKRRSALEKNRVGDQA